MPRTLVISDANILIDMKCGDLLVPMFQLEYRFAVPDVLFESELRVHHPEFMRLGLRKMELTSASVEYVLRLAAEIGQRGVGRNDLFALALARQESCMLLTGDARLRALAEKEDREVHGTLWLVGELLGAGRIRPATARRAYEAMRAAGRRLPWDEVKQQLESFRK
jgi:hypothetical protein